MSETNEDRLKQAPRSEEATRICPLIEVDFANSTALSTSTQRALEKATFSASRIEFEEQEVPLVAEGQLVIFSQK